jgi:hypothetical protein
VKSATACVIVLATGASVAVVRPIPARPAFVLNEVLYDPDGTDTGREFVEIASASGTALDASLAGWVLETGNGARPGEWEVEWVGGAEDRAALGLFVVGEAGVAPAPDAVAELDLQNGPDACRLRGPNGETDLLGWGAGLDTTLSEGTAAPDVPGLSLARLPDAFDTGNNAADFTPRPPSPGAFNAPDSALAGVSAQLPPPGTPPGVGFRFVFVVRNVGRRAVVPSVRVACAVHPGETLARAASSGALASGGRDTLEAYASPPAGAHLPAPEPAFPDTAGAWTGHGQTLHITEVYPRPDAGGSEWVELVSGSRWMADLSHFVFTDRSGGSGGVVGHLPAHGRAVLVADSAAFRSRWPLPPGVPTGTASPWPPLNHTGEPVADRVALLLAGEEVAVASWPGGIGLGISWERVSVTLPGEDPSVWGPSLAPRGASPGFPNSRTGDRPAETFPSGGALVASPSPFRPMRGETVALRFILPGRAPPPGRVCSIRVHDSSGLLLRDLRSWADAEGAFRAVWDGTDGQGGALPRGVYLVVAETAGVRPARAAVVLDR